MTEQQPLRFASQREVDLLNATVFGVQGQGGLLREIDSMHKAITRQTRLIITTALTMSSALLGLAAAIIATR